MDQRDPIQSRAKGSLDLYDVATWEVRTGFDRLAVLIYRSLVATARAVVVLAALLIFVLVLATASAGALLTDPIVGILTLLSAVPAFLLAVYVYVADVTAGEPLQPIVATFLLGILFAGFAGVVNSIFGPGLQSIGLVGFVIFFYLVVAPVEETVKWLAVRLHAYRLREFNAVVDGAVYGAVAGLGFATIENALYISQQLQGSGDVLGGGVILVVGLGTVANILGTGGEITVFRALAGPGHVIYSAFAGYYLGLAKFNPQRAGPIVVKGLLIAALIHATYNTLVGIVPSLALAAFPGLDRLAVSMAFIIAYDGLFGYALYRKLSRYRSAYRSVHGPGGDGEPVSLAVERTEFDG